MDSPDRDISAWSLFGDDGECVQGEGARETINRDENECLDCHLEGVEVEKGRRAPKVPPSHFRNDHTGEVKTNMVVGIRYNCTQCHVPQADEEPPVPQMAR
jgi:nitrate reductase cytochrome c-type subunit